MPAFQSQTLIIQVINKTMFITPIGPKIKLKCDQIAARTSLVSKIVLIEENPKLNRSIKKSGKIKMTTLTTKSEIYRKIVEFPT